MKEINHCGMYATKATDTGEIVEDFMSQVMAQTEKAFLLRDGNKKAWFPKSVVCVHTWSRKQIHVKYPDWFEPKWESLEEGDLR